ncbi:MAG: hypothetical protein Q3964_04620 [Carnobacterium sp.]|nr:hypothetical protein [Carnobacterium sp.]
MFKQYLKPLLIAGCSLLMLAGCGNQTATTTTTATTAASSNPLEGKWEQIDFRSSLERAFGYDDSYESPEKLIFADAFKDVIPTLTITGNDAVYEFTTTTNVAFGNYYDYLKGKKPTSVEGSKEEYIKEQYNNLKRYLGAYTKAKGVLSAEFNDEKYEIHQTLKGIKINESDGTMEFQQAIKFIELVTFSGKRASEAVAYRYSIEDGILTLFLEQKQKFDNGDVVTLYYTMRFKKVAE